MRALEAGGDRTAPRLTIGLTALLALLILLPFLLGYVGTPPGYEFRGTLKPSGDESQYLAAVRMGMGGAWLWHDPYMVQAPPPILMYPLYLLAGQVAAPFTHQVGAVYALLHVIAALGLAAALWAMAAPFLDGTSAPSPAWVSARAGAAAPANSRQQACTSSSLRT